MTYHLLKPSGRAVAALSIVAILAACDNPVHSEHHEDAAGVRVTLSGAVVAESQGATVVVNNLPSVGVGAETGLLQVSFLAEDGDVIDLSGEADFSLAVVFANPAVATFQTAGAYDGRIRGLQAGATTVQFELRHGSHADFTSRPFDITVTAP